MERIMLETCENKLLRENETCHIYNPFIYYDILLKSLVLLFRGKILW